MVLTMVYHTQNYWFFGLFPSSSILGTRKHDVSETVIEVGSVQGAQLSRCLTPLHLRTETDPDSETSCFLVPRIPDMGKVQKPSNSELDVFSL
jgi:hypothetical protein